MHIHTYTHTYTLTIQNVLKCITRNNHKYHSKLSSRLPLPIIPPLSFPWEIKSTIIVVHILLPLKAPKHSGRNIWTGICQQRSMWLQEESPSLSDSLWHEFHSCGPIVAERSKAYVANYVNYVDYPTIEISTVRRGLTFISVLNSIVADLNELLQTRPKPMSYYT